MQCARRMWRGGWWLLFFFCCFFFQAEDGIRDYKVTGVQTCALPISSSKSYSSPGSPCTFTMMFAGLDTRPATSVSVYDVLRLPETQVDAGVNRTFPPGSAS